MFEQFSDAIWGGALIGGAAVLLLFTVGYPVGISGFLSKALSSNPVVSGWRLSFLAGMLVVAFIIGSRDPSLFSANIADSHWVIILGALLVGAGARVAGGCTSGHSLCGMGRLDLDSIVATLVFIVSGAATVLFVGV